MAQDALVSSNDKLHIEQVCKAHKGGEKIYFLSLQSAWMSKITNDGLTRSGIWFTQIATVGVKGLKLLVPRCHPYHILRHPLSHPIYKSVEPPLNWKMLHESLTSRVTHELNAETIKIWLLKLDLLPNYLIFYVVLFVNTKDWHWFCMKCHSK